MKRSETKQNIIDIIKDYSQEFGIAPHFVEKDYYVVKILSEISKFDYPDLQIVFSGGTCLSKAYKKIKRFSEDIDFRVHTNRNFTRKERKLFCRFVIDKLYDKDMFKILPNTIKKGNENNFFSFDIEYKKLYEYSALRPNVKVEFTFDNLILPNVTCEISSFIGGFINELPIQVNCIHPIEVCANKFSALMWRVFIKNRNKPLYSKENDPTIIRHLYDVTILEELLFNKIFVEILQQSFKIDKVRGCMDCSFKECLNIILNKLSNDKIYKKEYVNFVESMCFSKNEDIMSYEQALNIFQKLCTYICSIC